jgi:hypothetical protein
METMMPLTTRLIAAFVLLAACMPQPDVPQPVPVGLCGAAALQGLVGQPASVLQTMKFGGPTRITRPGQAVTMDYSESRLNIKIDKAERIARVTCG